MFGIELVDIFEKRKLISRLWQWVFFIVLIFVPLDAIEANENNTEGDVRITAVVLFTSEFSSAVMKNSRIQIDKKVVFVGDTIIVKATFSNGEVKLKKEQFVCDFYDNNKQMKFSYTIKNIDTDLDTFSVTISPDMVGTNSILCRIIGYEKLIPIHGENTFFVLPGSQRSFHYLLNQ